jgi:hypothetical protein
MNKMQRREKRLAAELEPIETVPIKLRAHTEIEKRVYGIKKSDWILSSWNRKTRLANRNVGKGWNNADGSISIRISDLDNLQIVLEISNKHNTLHLRPNEKKKPKHKFVDPGMP